MAKGFTFKPLTPTAPPAAGAFTKPGFVVGAKATVPTAKGFTFKGITVPAGWKAPAVQAPSAAPVAVAIPKTGIFAGHPANPIPHTQRGIWSSPTNIATPWKATAPDKMETFITRTFEAIGDAIHDYGAKQAQSLDELQYALGHWNATSAGLNTSASVKEASLAWAEQGKKEAQVHEADIAYTNLKWEKDSKGWEVLRTAVDGGLSLAESVTLAIATNALFVGGTFFSLVKGAGVKAILKATLSPKTFANVWNIAASSTGARMASAIIPNLILSGGEAAPVYRQLIEKGTSADRAMATMLVSGAGTAVLEAIGLDAIFRTWMKNLKAPLVARLVNSITEATFETTQELSQNVWQNTVRKYMGKDPDQAAGFGSWKETLDTIIGIFPSSLLFGGATFSWAGFQKSIGKEESTKLMQRLLETHGMTVPEAQATILGVLKDSADGIAGGIGMLVPPGVTLANTVNVAGITVNTGKMNAYQKSLVEQLNPAGMVLTPQKVQEAEQVKTAPTTIGLPGGKEVTPTPQGFSRPLFAAMQEGQANLEAKGLEKGGKANILIPGQGVSTPKPLITQPAPRATLKPGFVVSSYNAVRATDAMSRLPDVGKPFKPSLNDDVSDVTVVRNGVAQATDELTIPKTAYDAIRSGTVVSKTQVADGADAVVRWGKKGADGTVEATVHYYNAATAPIKMGPFNAVRPALTPEEQRIVQATARGGTFGAHSMVEGIVKRVARKGESILDYGAGPAQVQTKQLQELGFDVTPYDIGLNPEAVQKKYYLVMASNVLNVQPSESAFQGTLDEMAAAVEQSGRLIANLPVEPRKWEGLTASYVEGELRKRFDNVTQVGGTHTAPVWEATDPIRQEVFTQEDVLQWTTKHPPKAQELGRTNVELAINGKQPWEMTFDEFLKNYAVIPPMPSIPEEGQWTAIEADDGSIFPAKIPYDIHVVIAQRNHIPYARMRVGGYLRNGIFYDVQLESIRLLAEVGLARERLRYKQIVRRADSQGLTVVHDDAMNSVRVAPTGPFPADVMRQHQEERWNRLTEAFPSLKGVKVTFTHGLLAATESDLAGEGVEPGQTYSVAGNTRLMISDGIGHLLVTLYSNADEFVVMEEALHVGWLGLNVKDREAFTAYYETQNDNRSVEEYFAQEGVDWLANAKAQPQQVDNIFRKVARWMANMFHQLMGDGKNTKINGIYQRAMEAAGMVNEDFLKAGETVSLNALETKQPWQMTLDEIAATGTIAYDTKANHYIFVPGVSKIAPDSNAYYQAVRKAIAEGMDVPQKVRDQYPELQPMEPAPERRTAAPLTREQVEEEVRTAVAESKPERVLEILEQVRNEGRIDVLTGLKNRVAWEAVDKTGKIVASCDLTGLHAANNQYGHLFGDTLLVTVAAAFQHEGVDAYRIGGDEFAGLFASQEEADAKMQAVQKLIEETELVAEANGQKVSLKGWRLDYGTGEDYATADKALLATRADLEARGIRLGREGPSLAGAAVVAKKSESDIVAAAIAGDRRREAAEEVKRTKDKLTPWIPEGRNPTASEVYWWFLGSGYTLYNGEEGGKKNPSKQLFDWKEVKKNTRLLRLFRQNGAIRVGLDTAVDSLFREFGVDHQETDMRDDEWLAHVLTIGAYGGDAANKVDVFGQPTVAVQIAEAKRQEAIAGETDIWGKKVKTRRVPAVQPELFAKEQGRAFTAAELRGVEVGTGMKAEAERLAAKGPETGMFAPVEETLPEAPLYLYHKTTKEALEGIKKEGMTSGDFVAGYAIDYGTGDVTIRVKSSLIKDPQIGEYGAGVPWYLPNWDTQPTISPADIELKVGRKWVTLGERVIPAQEAWQMTQNAMVDALEAGAEPAATVPGEPFEFFGADENMENAKAAIFDNGEGRYYITKADGLYVKNPVTTEPLFDTVDEAWKEYHRQAVEQAVAEGKDVPAEVLAEQEGKMAPATKEAVAAPVKPTPIANTPALAKKIVDTLDSLMKDIRAGKVTKATEGTYQKAFRMFLKNAGLPTDSLNWSSVLAWYRNPKSLKTLQNKVALVLRAMDRYNIRKQKAYEEQQAAATTKRHETANVKIIVSQATQIAHESVTHAAQLTKVKTEAQKILDHVNAMHTATVERYQLKAIRREQQLANERDGQAWLNKRKKILTSLDRSIGAVEANVRKGHTIALGAVDLIRQATKGLLDEKGRIDRNVVRFETNDALESLRSAVKDAIAIGRLEWLQEKKNRKQFDEQTAARIIPNLHPIQGRAELVRAKGELEPSITWVSKLLNEGKRLGIGLTPMESVFRGLGCRELYIEMLTGLNDARLSADKWRRARLEKAKSLDVADAKSQQRIGVWLINQTEGGRDHLLRGNKLTEDEIDTIQLTDNEQAYAAYVRNHFEETYPILRDYFRAIYNIEVKKEDMYISLFGSGRYSDSFSINSVTAEMNIRPETHRKAPTVSMAHPRVGGDNPVLINVFEIGDRYDETIAYALHLGPRLIKWWDIQENDQVKEKLGTLGSEIMRDYLTTLTLRGGPGSGRARSGFDVLADGLRRNFSRAQILFRPTSALLQLTQVINVAAFTGAGPVARAGSMLMDADVRKFVTENFPLLRDDMKGYFEVLGLTDDKLTTVGGWLFTNLHMAARCTGALANYMWLLQEHDQNFDMAHPNKELLIESMAMVEKEFGAENIASRPAVLESGYGMVNDKSLGRLVLQFQQDTLAKWSMMKDLVREMPDDPLRSLGGLFWLLLISTMLAMPLVRRMWRVVSGGKNTTPLYQESIEALLETIPFMNGVSGIFNYGQIPVPALSALYTTAASVSQMIQYQSMPSKVRAGAKALAGIGSIVGIPGSGTAGGIFDNIMKHYTQKGSKYGSYENIQMLPGNIDIKLPKIPGF